MTTPPFPQPPTPAPGSGVPVQPDPFAFAPVPPAAANGSPRSGVALGWAIGAAVASGIAVLLSVVAIVLAGGAFAGGAADEGYYEPVRGQVVALPDGSALSGDRLEWAVDGAERDLGWTIEDLDCPDTPSVGRSSAVVCTGTIDGEDWTGVVFFEDSAGSFVVLEL